MTDRLKKDTTVYSKYEDSYESYVEVDNIDNFIDVVDIQNGTAKAILPCKGCERIGVWIWDYSFDETLEEFIDKIYKENFTEE